jgi:pyruvate dehydrogenase E1 component beta subunit
MNDNRRITYSEALNEALREEMERDSSVYVLGEDIAKIGGLFDVTKGLLDEFGPRRVIDTPISEAAIAGAGIGGAMAGARPVVEFQFSDFMTIAMDQIVNHAAKLRYMTGGQVRIPVVMRAPICSGIGMGAQHSQSLESWFVHIPGLVVIMPSNPYAAKGLLKAAIRDDNPVIFLENRRLYSIRGNVPGPNQILPIGKAAVVREGADLTVVATGRMVRVAEGTARKLSRTGVELEVIDPQTLKPLDMNTILASVRKTGRAVVVNEACRTCGFAAEVAATIAEFAHPELKTPVLRVTAKDSPMPVSQALEKEILPGEQDLFEAVHRLLPELENKADST